VSSLQEISSNVDTISLVGRRTLPELPMIKVAMGETWTNYDLTYSHGNKPIFGRGIQRLRAFAQWVFTRDEDIIIVGAHSLWCRDFFRTFMPHNSPHNSKNTKIKNCGLIGLTLTYGTYNGQVYYRIDPQSIQEIYLGFEYSSKVWYPPRVN